MSTAAAFPSRSVPLGENGHLPKTMAAYAMQGTPTLMLIDRFRKRRAQYFGHVTDLRLGAEIIALVAETADGQRLVLQ